ncbi:MAG: GNAT family N-acetyltransferase [Deltaproteobacteria bacterium]|nr:GNAT family N-acetyltransferase [Deltaproteobacteria bacterium]
MEIKIRGVEAKDKDAIESIIRDNENFTDEERYCAVELLDIYLKDLSPNVSIGETVKGEYIFVCAADETDKPLGYVCYGNAPFTDGVYDMYWIAVDPPWQGKRVGKMLIKHLENILKHENARMIIAETSSQPKYDKARLFYEKSGFMEASRIKDFYRVGDDKIVYIKQLKGAS